MATEGPRQRLLLDTNILLDFVDPARACHDDAVALFWYAAERDNSPVRLMASISSFKDVYYILCRLYADEPRARKLVGEIMGAHVEPVDLLASYGSLALESDEPDYEDGLLRVTAEDQGVTVIISRDEKAFGNSLVPRMSAGEYLATQDFDYKSIDF